MFHPKRPVRVRRGNHVESQPANEQEQIPSSKSKTKNMDLNNKLIQLPDVHCVVCKNFLNFPIYLTPRGNICGRCDAKDPGSSTRMRNEALENMINLLEVPCRYKTEGCMVKLLYDVMLTHEEYCTLRQYCCPSKEDCFWRGSLNLLSKHFEDFHPTLYLKSETNTFEFNIDMSLDKYEAHMLLVSFTDTYLLQIKIDNDQMWCAVCFIGNENKGAKYEYMIEEIGYKKSFYFRHDSRKAMLAQSYMSQLDKDRAIEVDMSPLKIYFCKADILSVKLKIIGDEPLEDLDESILSHLECPVCNLYMLPPIHQCLTGHNVCCKCRPKLGQCPTCRGRIENTRNYALEAVSVKTRYPCVNRIYGCMAIFPGSLIEKHEQDCQLRTYNCIMQNTSCTWQGKHNDLIEHLRMAHKVSNVYQTKVNYSTNQFYMYTSKYDYLVAYGEVFKVGHKYETNSQTTYWTCRVLGTQNKNKFNFTISYCNDSDNFLLVKKSTCQVFTTDEEFFSNSLTFQQNLITRVGNTVKCVIENVTDFTV